MADVFTKAKRSDIMSRIAGKNTKPELSVRSALHCAGYRFRLHRKDLPGKPDLILPKHRVAVFVHGCFWHGHCCKRGKRPTTNEAFWTEKLDRNLKRDETNVEALEKLGWTVWIIWECEIAAGTDRLLAYLRAK
ncbi:DNA mismatch endonuclease Vsr [Hoeflea sp. G2-23]|uniref:Very short patch repair endonuclease n=1 Tax=Hoeflea algicola TaxID=2983763 RepID=A0ABT3ZAK7_9HYPH|nr:DNA mismatch endonuclease Vsr [Hoeflea algicola]MCY0148828.1 DNA mismatch endonuclease Vsr [Hoeflea algicola]